MTAFLQVSCGVFMSDYGKAEGNLAIAFETTGNLQPGAARSAVPGAGTLGLLEYRITLTNGSQSESAVVAPGQGSAVLSVTPGLWDIQAEAYIPAGTLYNDIPLDEALHVGTGSAQARVFAGQANSASIKMIFDNTTPASVEVTHDGQTYEAVREGTVYTVMLTNYDASHWVDITINKAVPDQEIVDSSDTALSFPWIKTLTSDLSIYSQGDSSATTVFTVKANDTEGFTTTYTVKLIFGWPVNTTASPMDLKTRFGITTSGIAGVTEAFNAVHWLINTPEAGNFADIIQLGDWIDLDSLTVTRYHTGTAVPDDADGYALDSDTDNDRENGAINEPTNTALGEYGKLLRLIVVGKNSFHSQGSYALGDADQAYNDATPHVVFQFQNVPGIHRMNATDTHVEGYKASEMRKYLVSTGDAGSGNFYAGLTAAGVPDGVVWAPRRRVWNGFTQAEKDANATSSTNATVDTITDKLWLPTEREMFGTNTYSSSAYENSGNQARLEYYTDNTSRKKYDRLPFTTDYWTASPYHALALRFCHVRSFGDSFATNASMVSGVAPAFCVK
jgi:hypothetical protein